MATLTCSISRVLPGVLSLSEKIQSFLLEHGSASAISGLRDHENHRKGQPFQKTAAVTCVPIPPTEELTCALDKATACGIASYPDLDATKAIGNT